MVEVPEDRLLRARLSRLLRSSEWVLLSFFLYVAIVSIWFHPISTHRWLPFWVLTAAACLICFLSIGEMRGPRWFFSYTRDWAPLALTLTAYREMDWFTPRQHDFRLENAWVVYDRLLLDGWGARSIIESTGALLPGYFECCYLLVYAVGPFTIAMVYVFDKRGIVDRVLVIYLAGTLGAYALFPYFPSAPPRTVFPSADLPRVMTPLREFNLWLLGGYGIHSSVFPSAHVSSAFAAAWAMLSLVREKKWLGWLMLGYAVSVAIATVYGRYHYAVDAAAGFAISVAAFALIRLGKSLE